MKKVNTLVFLLILNGFQVCQAQQIDSSLGLKDYYKKHFLIGASVTPNSLKGESGALIIREFNTLTAENAMKPALIHPEKDRYFWTDTDSIVGFAKRNNMKMRGHTLCWHRQTPDWFFKDSEGKQIWKEELLARLKEHITNVVSRYKGQVYAWDVVNEAIDDDEKKDFRSSLWYEICGEEYIAKAFQYAHEADPDAKLFYNDYSTEAPAKREKIFSMIKKLIDQGVPIHGVGLQGHWSNKWPSSEELTRTIEKFSSLGIDIQITEMDISVYGSKENMDENPGVFTPEREKAQVEKYKSFFGVFLKSNNKISSVTFWNISDKHSWLDNFPVKNRKNYPLLFDAAFSRKKAYWEVVNLVK
jgi:endo-1,4-beta-xylanase